MGISYIREQNVITNTVTPQVQRANKKCKQEELEVRRNAAVAKFTPNMYDVHDINAILSVYPDAIKYASCCNAIQDVK